jgi:hypothetical protein
MLSDRSPKTGKATRSSTATDQSTELGIVSVVHEDKVSFSFHRNSISYMARSVQPDAQSWLFPILQSWEFTN